MINVPYTDIEVTFLQMSANIWCQHDLMVSLENEFVTFTFMAKIDCSSSTIVILRRGLAIFNWDWIRNHDKCPMYTGEKLTK